MTEFLYVVSVVIHNFQYFICCEGVTSFGTAQHRPIMWNYFSRVYTTPRMYSSQAAVELTSLFPRDGGCHTENPKSTRLEATQVVWNQRLCHFHDQCPHHQHLLVSPPKSPRDLLINSYIFCREHKTWPA